MDPDDLDCLDCLIADEDAEALVAAFIALTRMMLGGMLCAGLILTGVLRRRR